VAAGLDTTHRAAGILGRTTAVAVTGISTKAPLDRGMEFTRQDQDQ
jgi:hypothetical protein